MKPYRMLHLLQHITEQQQCPNCKAQLLPDHIAVDYATDESVFLTIDCPQCGSTSQAHVVIGVRDEQQAERIEAELTDDWSAAELQRILTELDAHDGGVSTLFPSTR